MATNVIVVFRKQYEVLLRTLFFKKIDQLEDNCLVLISSVTGGVKAELINNVSHVVTNFDELMG